MVARIGSAPAPVRASSLSAATKHDLAIAPKLKAGIQDVLMRVRFGQPLPKKDTPTQDRDGSWKAPNGDRLIRVQLSDPPPPGSADMPNVIALVNPKTNEFYHLQSGGFTGLTVAHGPMGLAASLKMTGTPFGKGEVKQLTTAANAPPAKPKLPTKKTIETAMGAYTFHRMLTYSRTAPKPADVLGEVFIKRDNHPDGYSFTALVLKSDPNTVIIRRSGGIAGISQYSNAINVTRIPR